MHILFAEIAEKMVITGEDAEHLHVLRPKIGDIMKISDGRRRCCMGKISEITKKSVVFDYLEDTEPCSEPKINAVLCCALLKSGKNDYVIQKAVELGAREIIFFESKNCVASEKNDKSERRAKIALQAAMQSGREIVPTVRVMTFKEAVEYAKSFDFKGFLHEKAESSFGQAIRDHKADGKPLNSAIFMVGPEGGFTENEAEYARENGIPSLLLGPRILRAETAPVCALSVIMAAAGEI